MINFNNKGVALIQVLIMTAIMSLIAIQFTKTAREQVSIAKSYQNRLKAELLLKTAKSRLLFDFFRYDPMNLSDKVVDGVKWNFRGNAFKYATGVEVKVQSTTGLLSLLTTPDSYWQKTLVALGEDPSDATSIINNMNDWVDVDDDVNGDGAEHSYYASINLIGPRNGPLQHISELQYIKGISTALYKKIKPLTTIYTSGGFNPNLAPKTLINALFSEDIANQIIDAQNNGNFSEEVWSSINGSNIDNFIVLHPRSTFIISLKVKFGDVVLTDNFNIKVQPQKSRDPILILANY